MNKKRTVIIIGTISIILILGVWLILNSSLAFLLVYQEDYTFATKSSPDNSKNVTIMNAVVSGGLLIHDSILVIPGVYKKEKFPKDENYLRVSDDYNVCVKWLDDNHLRIATQTEPEVNNLNIDGVNIEVIVDWEAYKECNTTLLEDPEGVIFPREISFRAYRVDQRWTPTKNDISNAESVLKECLKTENNKIYEKIDDYKRQYIGIKNTEGTRIILINSFIDKEGNFKEWDKAPLMILDGGDDVFNIKIDLEGGKCLDLIVNSTA